MSNLKIRVPIMEQHSAINDFSMPGSQSIYLYNSETINKSQPGVHQ